MSEELRSAIETFVALLGPIVLLALLGWVFAQVRTVSALGISWLDAHTDLKQRQAIYAIVATTVQAAKQSGLIGVIEKEGDTYMNQLIERAQTNLTASGWHIELDPLEDIVREAVKKELS
jgi:uncharacterized lipoprotein YddW (UPF0748 family)